MREMLLTPKARKKIKIKFIFLPFSLGILYIMLLVCDVFCSEGRHFFDLLIIYGLILVIVVLSLFLNYSRMPAELENINKDGFMYKTVFGKSRSIRWEKIVEFKNFKGYGDMGILYQTRTGREGIEIRAEEGEKIRKAWEEWKARSEEDLNKKNG